MDNVSPTLLEKGTVLLQFCVPTISFFQYNYEGGGGGRREEISREGGRETERMGWGDEGKREGGGTEKGVEHRESERDAL